MSVYKDKRTNSWCYKFIYKGVQYHRCFKGATKDEVIGFESIAKSELRKSNYDIASDNHNYTLSQIIAEYKEFRAYNYARPEEFDYVIDKFYSLIGNKIAEQITLADLEKYRSYRKGKVKNSTINREMDNIKRVFSLAFENKRIRFNPCSELKNLKIENPNKRFLTKEEEKRLLKVANPTMRVMIILALNTGMRVGEILNLKWENIDFNARQITLKVKDSTRQGGKNLSIPMVTPLYLILKELPQTDDYVFLYRGRHFKSIKTAWHTTFYKPNGTLKDPSLPYVNFHILRHTAGTWLLKSCKNLKIVQQVLGHSNIQTTLKYAHILDEEKRNALDELYQ